MITEDYVSYEIAKLLEEKGFDEPCECFYDTGNNDVSIVNGWMDISNSELEEREFVCYSAPTLQMVMKWLRTIHNIDIEVQTHYVNSLKLNSPRYYRGKILKSGEGVIHTIYTKYTYEKVCEAGIKYCLENLI